MLTKEFLETYSLYKKVKFEVLYYQQYLVHIKTPAINMECNNCKSMQTFNIANDIWELRADNRYSAQDVEFWNKPIRCVYLCSACNSYYYFFFVQFLLTGKSTRGKTTRYKGYYWKIGQTPSWEIDIDRNLEKSLGVDVDLYKKGLVCESQSYGIGSYAYFRRITENIIDELLNSIVDLLDQDDKAQYQKALEKVKNTRITEEKIELVQDLLPSALQPDGYNPLKALHSSLSEGIHSKTDEECLELAETIKAILVYLLEEIRSRSDKAKIFSEKMKKLLGKK